MNPGLAFGGGLFLMVLAGVFSILYWRSLRTQTAVANPGTGAAAVPWRSEPAATPPRGKTALVKRLSIAGYRSGNALGQYQMLSRLATVVMALAGAGLGLWVDGESWGLGLLLFGGLGYFLPSKILTGLGRARKRRLRRGLPAALDLMVLSVEAGQAVDAAVQEAARGLRGPFPDLAAELTLLGLELRAAKSRVESFRSLAERTDEPEVKKFTGLLIDTDRFGTQLGPALRNHARYLRIRMRQEAQEKARKVGVKLIFPVFFLIFPSVVLVTLGPAVILITTQMKNFLAK
jgi:tight adherence protein C